MTIRELYEQYISDKFAFFTFFGKFALLSTLLILTPDIIII